MPEKPDTHTFKETLKMRRNYVGRSCKLHYEVSPLKIVRASRQYMYDDCGNEFLDCINNISHVGHCHPHVMGAGQEQMSKLTTSYGFLTDIQVEYAKRIVELLPEHLCVCYFLNSGSEANDLALRLARAYTKNHDIMVVENAYHGNTENLIKISPSRLKKHNLPKEDWVHIVPVPDTYRGKYREDSVSPGHLYAQEVKIAIHKAIDNGRSIAAFMSEPLMSLCGVVVPPPNFHRLAYRYVREAGGICIADEVQTGLGRCGETYWAFETQDIVPDIITLGKPLGNGHPMAVVVTSKEISDSLTEFSSTFGGNPVACAMGMAVLDVIKNEQLLSSAKSVGKCLIQGLEAILPNHRMMGNVRGMGMIVGLEIVEDKESRKPNSDAAEILVYKLKERYIMTSNEGPDKNVIIFLPPMCFTCDNARTAVQAVDTALSELEESASQANKDVDDSIQVPLSILTGQKHKLDSDDDDYDDESPSKRPLLLRKKRRVDFCKEEIIMILHAYRAHPTRWADVVEDVKSNLNVLPEPTRQLYETGSDRQLKDRISSKLGRLVAAGANIQDGDIRREVDLVRALERQHVDQPALVDEPNLGNEEPNFNQPLDRNRGQAALNPESVDNQPEPAQVRPADRRDAIAADLSDPEDEPPRQRRRLKYTYNDRSDQQVVNFP
ncbi:hypothetical protein ACF0H5_001301 [Mactra antiquata]